MYIFIWGGCWVWCVAAMLPEVHLKSFVLYRGCAEAHIGHHECGQLDQGKCGQSPAGKDMVAPHLHSLQSQKIAFIFSLS